MEAGNVGDYESSTGIFITAENELKSLEWGEQIAQQLFQKIIPDEKILGKVSITSVG